MGVAVDLIVFPPDSGETINSVDVRVRDFEIFDHVPSSTWRKFVTCLIEPSAREMNKPMIDLELVTVKPITELAASELVIRVSVLPLRLHVDQDALDFITRFFEFKDDSVPSNAAPPDQPFIQRLEVRAVTLKLDYKPKRVDYRGIRSGHTTEFMNFLILDGSDIILRHAIVYGITSFDKLHKTLNDVWMPDVKRNQLPGVLSGLAAVRPLVNVGSGMRDLVVVPMREYRKDGRIVRSLQKGVYAFAKNTTSEVARLGAKVAIGTQTLLEGAETFLAPRTGSPAAHQAWEGEDPDSATEEERAVSHYANQPIGVRAGLRSAARHLERDLLTARDAVIAIPAEVMEEGSGVGMARALARHAPTVILRPALGATKALSNALLGVGNALDEGSRRKIEDVSCPPFNHVEVRKANGCNRNINRLPSTQRTHATGRHGHGIRDFARSSIPDTLPYVLSYLKFRNCSCIATVPRGGVSGVAFFYSFPFGIEHRR
jgi:autophagy-related protein 2